AEPGLNEVQSLLNPAATGGTFTLRVNVGGVNRTTAALNYNATYQQIEDALNVLFPGKVKVTDADLLYTISSITNIDGTKKLAFVEQDREIIFNQNPLLDMVGVSLVTAAPVDLKVQSGYLLSSETVSTDLLNSVYVNG